MLAFCDKHQQVIGYVILYRLDRFARNRIDYFTITAMLRSKGINLISVTQGIEDTPEGSLMEGIVACFGEYESAVIGVRARDGMKEARRQGRLTNAPPIGYIHRKDDQGRGAIVVDEQRAPLVTEAFKLFADESMTMAEITRLFNHRGFKAPRGGKRFTQQNLFRMLHNRLYTGYILISPSEGYARTCLPALVDEATFERVQAKFRSYESDPPPRTIQNPNFPLRGFIRCGVCNKPLTGSFSTGKNGRRYPFYHCFGRTCGQMNVRKEVLETAFGDFLENLMPPVDEVTDLRHQLIDGHIRRQQAAGEELAAIDSEIADLEGRLKTLHSAYVFEKRITQDVYEKMVTDLQKEIARRRIQKTEIHEESVDLEALLDQALRFVSNSKCLWENADSERKSVIQRLLFPSGLGFTRNLAFGNPVDSHQIDVLSFFGFRNSLLAVLCADGWNPFLAWLRGICSALKVPA